jgi:N-methylhydantoinase A
MKQPLKLHETQVSLAVSRDPEATGREALGVDIGGTFTDFVLLRDGKLTVHKRLSDRADPARPLLAGVAELGLAADGEVVHGSTVATNALLERRGARTALIATRGFADVIEIGRQARPHLYDFHQTRPPPLVPGELRFELDERVDAAGKALRPPGRAAVEELARRIAEAGAESVAVSLLFSFLNRAHEDAVRNAIRAELGDAAPLLSLSADVLPEHREYERTSTVAINAYVAPVVARYLERIERGLGGRPFRVFQSNGGSIAAATARREAARTAFSGPAGGVAGAFAAAREAGCTQVITFDAGGTSTDCALCPGAPRETTEGSIAGLPLSLPMLDIHSVGAGGGSIARVDAGGALRVGPESAGADPGPACYGRGGKHATVTDAHLALGRIPADRPLGGSLRLDIEAARAALAGLAAQLDCDLEAAARGVLRVATAAMERAVRKITVERGHDPRAFTLVAFGGAGPLHACELAEALAIPAVLVPRWPGVLSALGMLGAEVVKDYSQAVLAPALALADADLERRFAPLEARARSEMAAEGVPESALAVARSADLRYAGQSYELRVPCAGLAASVADFHRLHERRFGHAREEAPVEVVTVRVRAAGRARELALAATAAAVRPPRVIAGSVRDREDLVPGDRVTGPGVIHQADATTYIAPGWEARVDERLNLILRRGTPA